MSVICVGFENLSVNLIEISPSVHPFVHPFAHPSTHIHPYLNLSSFISNINGVFDMDGYTHDALGKPLPAPPPYLLIPFYSSFFDFKLAKSPRDQDQKKKRKKPILIYMNRSGK